MVVVLVSDIAPYVTGRTIAVNNSPEPQTTLLYDGRGRRRRLRIAPYQSVWV